MPTQDLKIILFWIFFIFLTYKKMTRFCSRCILLNDENEILFVKHNPDSKYSIPWWHIEGNEDPYQALIREAKEELGFQIKIIGNKTGLDYEHIKEFPLPIYIQDISYTSPKHWPQSKFEYFFVAKVMWWNFKVQSEEIVDYKRINLDELNEWKDLDIFENIVEIIVKNRAQISTD